MFRRTMCACGKCVQVVDLLPIPLKEMGFLVALRPPSMEPKTLHGHRGVDETSHLWRGPNPLLPGLCQDTFSRC
jgi:hypothetical protein